MAEREAARGLPHPFRALLLGLALAGCLGWPAFAEDDACRPSVPVVIALEPMPNAAVALDSTQTAEDIQKRGQHDSGAASQGITFAYYEAAAGSEYKADVNGRRLEKGGICMTLTGVGIRFGFERRKIWLARELSDYPCIRARVMRHEHRHVAVDEALLGVFLPRLRASLVAFLAEGLAIAAPSVDAAGAQLKGRLESRLADARAEFVRLRTQSQLNIDRTDNGSTLMTECRTEVLRFLEIPR